MRHLLPLFLLLLIPAGSLRALDADTIQKLAGEPHSRENLLPELKLYPEAREYKISVRAGKSARELVAISEMVATEKTVQGRYLVSSTRLPGTDKPMMMVVSYDKEAELFRKWVLLPDGTLGSSTGLADFKTRTIAWVSDSAPQEGPNILSIETHTDTKSSWKETILKDGKVLSANHGEAVKTK